MTSTSHTSDMLISRLTDEFKGVKLLAMGQTVFWDEPVKAVLKRLLDERLPDSVMVAGIHDADYFSKIPANTVPEGWTMLPHNDGSTRDMWVAAAEISRLFGSETIPYRDLLTGYGVQLDKIARDFPGGRDTLINTVTEAWGWRGLVHVDSSNEVACCVSLQDALPHIMGLLEWGFGHSLDSISDTDESYGKSVADELIEDVKTYADANPEARISDMYCDLMVKLYSRLLGYRPANLELTRATELFRFNRSTAELPRFNLLRMFLNPETRSLCQESYDLAVEGSDAYTLDRFPDGAIPFDLVVPCLGRGTICLRKGRVVIDMDDPVSVPYTAPITTPEELAALLEDKFGPDISLVGKAITLVLMMAGEFIFVLHEEASAYVPRCEKMASMMKERGLAADFYPILRIDYHTWDSLSACDLTLHLPGHLASVMGQGEITSTEFADTWQSAADEQDNILKQISEISSIDELLDYLTARQPETWNPRISEYRSATTAIRDLSARTEPLKSESVGLRDLSFRLKQDIQQTEAEKGEHFRTNIKPLKDKQWDMESNEIISGAEWDAIASEMAKHEADRSHIEQKIADMREQAKAAMNRSLEIKNMVRDLEKGEEAEKARQSVRKIEYEAELSRLWLVRDAILVSKGLRYTDHRPSAWWFLLTDPELRWFNKVAETAEYYFEEISV
ncbi:MAG: zinc ribbon domain-containing protein [Armatimonadota bacterium]